IGPRFLSPVEADNRQAHAKQLLKPFADGLLNLAGLLGVALSKRGDRRGDFNRRFDCRAVYGTAVYSGAGAVAVDPPFGRTAIGGEAAVEKAGSGSVLVGDIAANNSAEPLDIEVGILQLERIEGPFNQRHAALHGVLALEQLETPAHTAIIVLRQD